MGGLLGRLYSAVSGLAGARKERFSPRHLEIFSEDLHYVFKNSAYVMKNSNKIDWQNPESIKDAMSRSGRNNYIINKLESLYDGLDRSGIPAGLREAIEHDIIDARSMNSDCCKEIIGPLDEPYSGKPAYSRAMRIFRSMRNAGGVAARIR